MTQGNGSREMEQVKRILSIQSHVTSGYVGNKAAVTALLYSGYEVDAINTVLYSNHTGYGRIERDKSDGFLGWTGRKVNRDEVMDLFLGLKRNKLIDYDYILTGYVGSEDTLKSLVGVIQEIKQQNQQVFVLIDPVLGDNGKMYVPSSLLPIYRDELIQLSDLITPNQYEAEWLTGIKILSEQDALVAIKKLHQLGPQYVVISSVYFNNDDNHLTLYASERISEKEFQQIKIRFYKYSGSFTGTGDMFSALVLGYGFKSSQKFNLVQGCELALSVVNQVLQTTAHYKTRKIEEAKMSKINLDEIDLMKLGELKIVECRKIFDSPQKISSAQSIEQ